MQNDQVIFLKCKPKHYALKNDLDTTTGSVIRPENIGVC